MKRTVNGLIIATTTLLLTLVPISAQAHDEVVNTSPAAGATVDPGVIALSVTFNEDVMKSPDLAGEVIEVVSPLNDVVTMQAGCLDVAGATLSTKVNIQAAGEYVVNWRSVSNDGHPNEGSYTFTVGKDGADPTQGLQAAADGACAAAYSAIDTEATPMAISETLPAEYARDAKAPATDPFIANLPYLIAGIVLVFLGALAGPLMQKRRERKAAQKAVEKQLEQEQD
jgi:methionine-rich copper-binding protein CopC